MRSSFLLTNDSASKFGIRKYAATFASSSFCICETACLRILDQEPNHFGALCTLAQCLSKVIRACHLPHANTT